MMKPSLFHEMYMMYAEAYAPHIVDQLKQKFIKQDAALTDEVMEWYINRFNAIKDSPRIINFVRRVYKINQPTDIFNYSWSQLENTVDQLPAPETRPQRQHAETSSPESRLIYDENQLQIYDAPSKQACIHLGHHQFGKSYSFCVSRKAGGNLYDSYRSKKRSFYFVYDESLPANNDRHLLVIQASPQSNNYIVTNAANTFEKQLTWQQVVQMQPKLRGLENLFEYHEFSPAEKLQADIQFANASTFDKLNYERKVAYIAADKTIYMDSWLDLPRDLKKMYVDLAANRRLYHFFDNNASEYGLLDLDPVRVLQQHLPQEAERYAKRARENYQQDGRFETTEINGEQVYQLQLPWNNKFKSIVKNLSAQLKNTINQMMPSKQAWSQMVVNIWHDAQTMMVVGFGLRFKLSDVYVQLHIKNNELQNCSIGFEPIAADVNFGTNINEMQATLQLLASYDVAALNVQMPQLLEKLAEYSHSNYAAELFAHCIIEDEMVENEQFKSFFIQTAASMMMLYVPVDSADDAIEKLQQSQLFAQLLQHPNKAPKLLIPFKDAPHVHMLSLYDRDAYKYLYYAFNDDGKALAEYAYVNKVHGFNTRIAMYKKAKGDDAMPVYIKIIYANNGKQHYEDAAEEAEALHQKRLAMPLRAKKKASQMSIAAKHYLHLKAMGRAGEVDPDEYQQYIQEHGVQNEIKMGRKTIISNNPVFIGDFATTSAALSTPTLNNLMTLSRGLNIEWNKIYIQPLQGRVAFSFFIQGKNAANETIYYCRKEFNAQGAGQSFLVNATTGVQQQATTALSQLRQGE